MVIVLGLSLRKKLFSFAAAQLLVRMASAQQKSECCSAVSAAQLSEICSATSVFRLWHELQGWGLEGWGLGLADFRQRGGVQKSMGNKVPWKTGMLIYLPVTSRPLISLQKEAVSSPCNFATAHLTACILNFYSENPKRHLKRQQP